MLQIMQLTQFPVKTMARVNSFVHYHLEDNCSDCDSATNGPIHHREDKSLAILGLLLFPNRCWFFSSNWGDLFVWFVPIRNIKFLNMNRLNEYVRYCSKIELLDEHWTDSTLSSAFSYLNNKSLLEMRTSKVWWSVRFDHLFNMKKKWWRCQDQKHGWMRQHRCTIYVKKHRQASMKILLSKPMQLIW